MTKKLLVYFSYSGNTRFVADMIKDKVKCDALELKPKVAYSENYQKVVDEFQNNETAKTVTELQDYNINLDDYDTIVIGSPVWWYSITPVVRTFLKTNDLKGKIIIPFATNAGWLGRTFKEIKELCDGAIVNNEMNIVFDSEAKEKKIKNEKEVLDWIERISK